MKTLFSQFAESGIRSQRNHFDRATIRLTLYYALGAGLLILVFSAVVYGFFSQSVNNHEQIEYLNETALEGTLVEEIKENLFNIIVLADVVLMVLAVVVGYALSRKTLQPLKEIYQQQKRFLADAAHELRTPLAVMKAGAEVVLHKERSSKEYVDYVHSALGETNRLIDLSNDLLALARYGDQKDQSRQVLYSSVNMSDVGMQVCVDMASYALTHDIGYTYTIDPDLKVLGNGDDIRRAFMNMIKNAIDYNVTGGSVTITLIKDEKNVQLTIADTGRGIPEKDLPHIFERFYKVDNARTITGAGGTGLGLTLVQEIVHQHHGSISVKSNVGKGSEFTIILPCV